MEDEINEDLESWIIDRINEHVFMWPDSAFGPGHIVLEDYNIGYGHIEWCLNLIYAVLLKRSLSRLESNYDIDILLKTCKRLEQSDISMLETLNWYVGHDIEELAATAELFELFLEEM